MTEGIGRPAVKKPDVILERFPEWFEIVDNVKETAALRALKLPLLQKIRNMGTIDAAKICMIDTEYFSGHLKSPPFSHSYTVYHTRHR
jgi:hypothetical protein